jgi:hypothetical protein
MVANASRNVLSVHPADIGGTTRSLRISVSLLQEAR